MSSEQERQTLDFYLGLQYPVTVHADAEGGFVAEIEDLPGCLTQAETLEEVFVAMGQARHAWLRAAYETGQDIPLPREVDEYKGRVLLRIPRSLHRDLARLARREGVSLNQYIATLLASGVRGELITAYALTMLAAWQMGIPEYHLTRFRYFGTNEKPRRLGEVVELQRREVARR